NDSALDVLCETGLQSPPKVGASRELPAILRHLRLKSGVPIELVEGRMKSFMRSRAGSVAALTIVAIWSLAVSACGGSELPAEIGVPGGGSGGQVEAKTF